MSPEATVERPATMAFRPTFSELLASEDPELLREPLRRWMAVLWVDPTGRAPKLLGVYPVLAWEPEPHTAFDDHPEGHAVLLIPERDDNLGSHFGPVSTRDLPGHARYRREDTALFMQPAL